MNARKKGHGFELQIRDLFRSLGWTKAVTSRSESKNRDDQGVDLCYTEPFNIQCKAVEKLGPVHDILSRMPNDGINLVFHKRNRKGTVVSMFQEDFIKILNQQLCQRKSMSEDLSKEQTNSENQK